MTCKLLLADDSIARAWTPLSSTRPVGEILFGAMLLRERIERATGLQVHGYLPADGLEGFSVDDAPRLAEFDRPSGGESVVILSSRYVPPIAESPVRQPSFLSTQPHHPTPLHAAGKHVGWILPSDAPPPASVEAGEWIDLGDNPSTGPGIDLPGKVLATPWELVQRNAGQLCADLSHPFRDCEGNLRPGFQAPPGVEILGDHLVTAEAGVVVDPGAILDARWGPIFLARDVQVRPFTHLKGPAFVGTGSTLLGGVLDSFSCGPVCHLKGEVSKSVLLGFSNKAHEGYLGHSLVGRWVNLGAMTTNSDLKNNYGSIRVRTPDQDVDTGLLKLGVFLGDHVKTGIGTTLPAGTIVGVGSNLFGMKPPPKLVPPFSWGAGEELVPYRLEPFLKTAERVMARRGVEMGSKERKFLSSLWECVDRERGAERKG